MICPKCGAQCPDGVKFCPQCGNGLSGVDLSKPTAAVEPMMSDPMPSPLSQPVSSQIPQPVDSTIPQPVSSSVPQPSAFGTQNQAGQSSFAGQMGQPTFGGQPSQPSFGGQQAQPMQSPFGAQPDGGSYIPPQTYAPVVPVKRSKAPIIIGVCVAVIAVFLILLFTVILPNVGGGLEHKWTASENGVTMTFDFKNNTISSNGVSLPIEWKDEGGGRLSVTMTILGISSDPEYFTYELNGNKLILTDEDGDPVEFTRDD